MIKKHIYVISVFVLLISLFMSSCESEFTLKEKIMSRFNSDEKMDSAVQTVDLFFSSLVDKDFETAFSYIFTGENDNHRQDDFKNELRDATDIISYKINWVEVKNNIAIVGVDITDYYDGNEKLYKDIEVSLIEDDNIWKINFWK